VNADRLSARLRRETADLHARAERSGVMPLLIAGRLDRNRYCALLRSLHDLYEALEAALARHAGHPAIAPVWQPRLHRRAALAADLSLLHGEHWASELALPAAARGYVARLHELDRSAPQRLVAHAYVRYLGDLSGGQWLKSSVQRMLGLLDGHGLAFYDFGSAQDVALQARRLRAGLDACTHDEASARAIVDEARLAFGLHLPLFDELLGAGAAR
jgi:heme oxygenase